MANSRKLAQAKPTQELVSQREYARRRLVSSTWISKLVRAGKIPTVGGRIDVAAADRALADDTEQPDTTTDITFAEAERRWRLATARLKELELAKKEGELVDVEFVISAETVTFRRIRDVLLSIPTRVTGLVDAKDKRAVNATVTQLIHTALSNLQKVVAMEDFGDVLCDTCASRLRGTE